MKEHWIALTRTGASLAATCALAGASPGCTAANESAQTSSTALGACIPSGTEAPINASLVGNGAVAELCPGAVFQLGATVKFTAPNQRLETQGLPTDDTRAVLRIANASLTKAIDGVNQSGIVIQNVEVLGNRSELGHLKGDALITIGGKASGQTVSGIVAHGTRSWSTLHIVEGAVTGGVPACQSAKIINNTIGPAGTPDGNWADGISLACGNSLVQNNQVTDATDGAIVVFGAPGSLIEGNTITAASRTLLGGINMVDYKPVSGNYDGTRVTNNTIDAAGAFIKVGIAMGPAVWNCQTTVNHGGSVTNNRLQGAHLGYGYTVNGVSNWTVTGNVDQATHVGVVANGCGTPSSPAGFLYDRATTSTLQPEFVPASLSGVLGVSEPRSISVTQPAAECGKIGAGEGLVTGQSFPSCDGRFELAMQNDGNLVLYQGSEPLWATNTGGKTTAQAAILQADGNFVLYDTASAPVWSSGTGGHAGASLAVQSDGNLVVYGPDSRPLWASHTCCR